jgi:hypothetical protein
VTNPATVALSSSATAQEREEAELLVLGRVLTAAERVDLREAIRRGLECQRQTNTEGI